MKYTVKSVKNLQGREGHGYSCKVYRDGKKVAEAIDYADGAMGEVTFINDDEQQKFVDYVPKTKNWSNSVPTSLYIEGLVNEFQETKRLKRMCKKYTVFMMNGEMYQMKMTFTPEVKKMMEEKYGKDLEEIINERFAA